LTEEKSSSY